MFPGRQSKARLHSARLGAMNTSHTCAICQSLSGPNLYEDDLWCIRHAEPAGVPGWMMMISKRHVAGPAHFNDREATAFGLSLRHFEIVLERVTGALRIYTAAMGESYPHFHAHMVPRYQTMPREAKAWGVFDLERAVRSGELSVDRNEIARISGAYQRALAGLPRPW
jgi:diadenosine tetraphosphate (Ap4A) HIT family hydrolase